MLFNEDFKDGVQPDNDITEEEISAGGLRVKALLLLLVFLLPTLALIFEITTGQISLFWEQSIQPIFPQLDNLIRF